MYNRGESLGKHEGRSSGVGKLKVRRRPMYDLNHPRIRAAAPLNKWCVHSYYTLCPYAPDGSGRLLLAAADLEGETGEVCVVSQKGELLHRFGKNKCESNFYHTGFWQTWSADARWVYYQGGTMKEPKIIKHHLETGSETVMEGDMEGAPPFGEPIVSGLLGMLYAAGYGDGHYDLKKAPVPFAQRSRHGLFRYQPSTSSTSLLLSVGDVLEMHPDREKLLSEDRRISGIPGQDDGLTLMCYCVRWNVQGTRCLFYFGNHCVDKKRGEPRLAYIFTADRQFRDIRMALDISYDKPGVHWSWHPDGEHLIGYGPDPDNHKTMCLAQVAWDGSDYRKISAHKSGGHPSISPLDYNLLVTDEGTAPGRVVFIDLRKDREVEAFTLPRTWGSDIPTGRNPFRVCHHPVFNREGTRVLVNAMPGRLSALYEISLG